MSKLLTRDQFRMGVFERDAHKCVICKEQAKDAHHIIERRLFSDGGYYLENGASLCEHHHIEAEKTLLSCDEIRRAAGIEKIILPEHLYDDNRYDKWGNIIQINGTRLKGELFFDESVQKILSEVKSAFVDYVKYPRTYHLPWSPNLKNDDRMLNDVSIFEGKQVVVTEKMDGENTTMYTDYLHARSVDDDSHPSRNWIKNYWSKFSGDIPKGWRVCGENLFAKHAIHYKNLPEYLLIFSIWNEVNKCLSWDDTEEWCKLFEIKTVPVLYKGIWNEELIKNLHKDVRIDESEGYVVRLADSFTYGDFKKSIAKYVRKDHVQREVHHWKFQKITKNERANDGN